MPSRKRSGGPKSRPAAVPLWDGRLRQLWFADELIKQFHVPAANQIRVLDVFEEAGWPDVIDDPLPGADLKTAHRRVHDVIRRLNEGHLNPRLRFFGNGTGEAFCWQVIADDTSGNE